MFYLLEIFKYVIPFFFDYISKDFAVCHFYLFTTKLLKLIFFFYGCVGKMCYPLRSLELKILACNLTC